VRARYVEERSSLPLGRENNGRGRHGLNYSVEFLLGLYRTMVRIRLCEESLVELVLRRDVICPAHHCPGSRLPHDGVGA
jgi:TPP-dependent pyruvate/acetoin dehydrogenase alpha subunit